MKILLINPPVYTPTTLPYSLAAMKGELAAALDEDITVLDLNASFHYQEFPEFYQKLKSTTNESYFKLLEDFYNHAKQTYAKISKAAIKLCQSKYIKKIEIKDSKSINVTHLSESPGVLALKPNVSDLEVSEESQEEEKKEEEPIDIQELVNQIINQKPNVVAISVTYNSQIFMTKVIIEKLQETNSEIKIIIGGPADYSKIIQINPSITNLASAQKLIEYLETNGAKKRSVAKVAVPDFSDFNKDHYFTKDIVYPIRTSIACPYKRCTFCTHHGNKNYKQFDLKNLKQTILTNNIKKICFIDDDLTPKRLIEISEILQPLNVTWWCQLRPIKQIQPALEIAAKAGLTSVAWGLESGNQRVLDLIQKGTNLADIKETLRLAKKLNIKNQLYILFGFPTETRVEFKDTVNFLKENKDNIHLVSPSIFGLQYGSKTFESPEIGRASCRERV